VRGGGSSRATDVGLDAADAMCAEQLLDTIDMGQRLWRAA
jgi:hypothetical protein